jgi:threonine dehydrogenase-like Zn-dependent dehydrogenase
MTQTALGPKMKGLWLENCELRICDDIAQPQVLPGEALVRVKLAGICQTDLEMTKGYYPFTGIPGHEFVGEIKSAPDRPSWIGERVVGEINAFCGHCPLCLRGLPHHCLKRTVLGIVGRNGAFADYLALPLNNLHLVPDSVSDERAVFTEPLAAALQILEQMQIRPTDRILLVGAGKLGQLIARVLLLTGCHLSVMARHPSQASLISKLGVPLIQEKSFPQRHFDTVVEASGTAQGLSVDRLAVRPAGTIVLKSTYKGETVLDLASFVVDEITLLGSRCGPFTPAMNLLEKGIIDPTSLISGSYGLSKSIEAFDEASKSGVLKVLLRMQ